MTERRVTVPGSGAVATAPDGVVVRLAMSASGDGPAEALAACGRVQDAVVDELRAAGASGLRVGGVSVGQERDPQRQRVMRPVGTSWLSATLGDLAHAGGAVERALSAGGQGVRLDDLSPVLGDTGPALAQARELAYADARGRALAYAALSGDRLGELVSLVEGGAASAGGVMTFMSAEASYAVPQADVDVSVSLVATWELLPP